MKKALKSLLSKISLILSTIILVFTTISIASQVLADKESDIQNTSLIAIKDISPAKNTTLNRLEGICFTPVGNLGNIEIKVNDTELVPIRIQKSNNEDLICADANGTEGILGLTKISILNNDKGVVYYVYVKGE